MIVGVKQLKTYRLTCDGEVAVTTRDFIGTDQCEAVLDIQYNSRFELDIDLDRNMVGDGPPFTGWHSIWPSQFTLGGGIRCPRTDHIGDDQP